MLEKNYNNLLAIFKYLEEPQFGEIVLKTAEKKIVSIEIKPLQEKPKKFVIK